MNFKTKRNIFVVRRAADITFAKIVGDLKKSKFMHVKILIVNLDEILSEKRRSSFFPFWASTKYKLAR